jgi:hypothetical protein
MNQIRNGELLPQSTEYDPSADLAAHSASHKRTTVEHDSFLSKEQLAALRKVQMERTEVSSSQAKSVDGLLLINVYAGGENESARSRSQKLDGSSHGWK